MNSIQSVKRGVWYIGGRCRRQREQKGAFLRMADLLGYVAAPRIGEIAKPILRNIVGRRKVKGRHHRQYA